MKFFSIYIDGKSYHSWVPLCMLQIQFVYLHIHGGTLRNAFDWVIYFYWLLKRFRLFTNILQGDMVLIFFSKSFSSTVLSKSFTCNAIKDWNSLPEGLKQIQSEGPFRGKLKAYLMDEALRMEILWCSVWDISIVF